MQGRQYILTVTVDITERKRAEDAVRASGEKHRLLFETMSQGVVYYDLGGQLITANPAAERILGLSVEELQKAAFLDLGWKILREDGSELPAGPQPRWLGIRCQHSTGQGCWSA